MPVVVAVLVVVVVLVLSLGVLALAAYEHAKTRSHLFWRALAPTVANTLLVAVAVAIPSAGTMVTLASEDAGEALLLMAAVGALAGGACGLLFTPAILIGIGWLQRRRWKRAAPQSASEVQPQRKHPVSLTLLGCAAALGTVACLSMVSLWMLDPAEAMAVAAPFAIPGGLAALASLAGRRWLGGPATLVLNLLPGLVLLLMILLAPDPVFIDLSG